MQRSLGSHLILVVILSLFYETRVSCGDDGSRTLVIRASSGMTINIAQAKLKEWKEIPVTSQNTEEALSMVVDPRLTIELRQAAFEQVSKWMDLENNMSSSNKIACRLFASEGDRITKHLAIVLSMSSSKSGAFLLRKYAEVMSSDLPPGSEEGSGAISNSEFIARYTIDGLIHREIVTPEMVVNVMLTVAQNAEASSLGRCGAIGIIRSVLLEHSDSVSIETRSDVFAICEKLFLSEVVVEEVRVACGALWCYCHRASDGSLNLLVKAAINISRQDKVTDELRAVAVLLLLTDDDDMNRELIAAGSLRVVNSESASTHLRTILYTRGLGYLSKFAEGTQTEVDLVQKLANSSKVPTKIRKKGMSLIEKWNSPKRAM